MRDSRTQNALTHPFASLTLGQYSKRKELPDQSKSRRSRQFQIGSNSPEIGPFLLFRSHQTPVTLKAFIITVVLLGGVSAEEPKKKAPAEVLKADRCHYIFLGADPSDLHELNQMTGNRCNLSWTVFANKEQRFAALRLYRAEIEKTWPVNKKWDLKRDLEEIDKEDAKEKK